MTPTNLTNPLRANKPGQDLETFTTNTIEANLLSYDFAERPRICNVFIIMVRYCAQ